MKYQLRLSARAERYLGRLDRKTRARVLRKLDEITSDPHNPRFSKPLASEESAHSARVGDWRILFFVDEAESTVEVAVIGPRGQVYREI